jgi:hypothetical protein
MSAAAAQLLDTLVPIIRTRLPRGADADYLDLNRFTLEAVIEQNLGRSSPPTRVARQVQPIEGRERELPPLCSSSDGWNLGIHAIIASPATALTG